MNLVVDLNADLGEGAGHDDELLQLVSSASIACGFHAGDPVSILASIRAARERGVAVGAHPSFADRENFGRTEVALPAVDVFAIVAYQVGAFRALATAAGTRANHVKAHGALYNLAVRDEKLAEAIAHAVLAIDSSLLLFAPGESALERAAQSAKLSVVREVFADRNYLADGLLVPRTRPDALLHDPEEAAVRVLRMLREGVVRSVDGKDVEVQAETICIHGDTPGAAEFARSLRTSLEKNGVLIQAPQPTP
jgi:5-oxoprolinase (ATP-hydrolysing) subunit A